MDITPTSVPQSIERLGYTVAEACKAIPCSRSHLHRAIKKGNLRVARDGTKVLISRQAIIDYLDRGDCRDGESSAPTQIDPDSRALNGG
jgi:excisionase family DNA binding protein